MRDFSPPREIFSAVSSREREQFSVWIIERAIFTRLVSEWRREEEQSKAFHRLSHCLLVAEKLIDFLFFLLFCVLSLIVFYRARFCCLHLLNTFLKQQRWICRASSCICIVTVIRPIRFVSSRTSDDGVSIISREMVKRWRSHSTILCRRDYIRVSFEDETRHRRSRSVMKYAIFFSFGIFSRVTGWQSSQRVRSDRTDHQRDRAVWSPDGDDIQVWAVAYRHDKIDASVAGR